MTHRKPCSHCGAVFDGSDWHPTVAQQGTDGVEIYDFCSAGCREAWQGEETTS